MMNIKGFCCFQFVFSLYISLHEEEKKKPDLIVLTRQSAFHLLHQTQFARSCWFQLEKILKAQIDSWEQEHSQEFLVSGRKFLEYVQEQWESHHSEKEKEKLERVGHSPHWCSRLASPASKASGLTEPSSLLENSN